jgi:HD-like signal output (HDOD) protein
MSPPPAQTIDSLADVQLPALAYSKQALDRALARPSTGNADLAAIIGLDPGLTAQLYQGLSQASQRPGESIVEPSRIIGLLGMSKVFELAAGTPTLEERFRGPALLGLRKAYSRSLHAAFYARTLATLRGRPDTDAEAAVALLQNLGQLGLWAKKPGSAAELEAVTEQPEDLDLLGERQIGFSPSRLGQLLAERWSLPERTIRVQHFHNSFDATVQLPLLASALAWTTFEDWHSDSSEELIQLAADLTRLHPDMVVARLHRDAAQAARAAHERGLPQAASGLVYAWGGDPVTESATPAPAAVERRADKAPVRPTKTRPAVDAEPVPKAPPPVAKPVATPATPATPAASSTPAVTAAAAARAAATATATARTEPTSKPAQPNTPPANATLEAPAVPVAAAVAGAPAATAATAATAKTKQPSKPTRPDAPSADTPPAAPAAAKENTLQAKFGLLLHQARRDLGLQRILFAMLTPDRQHIRARFVREEEKSDLGSFKAPAGTRNLFAVLINKPAALWVNGDNQMKYLPLIPSEVAGLINTGEFMTVSVVVNAKPVGLLYADTQAGKLTKDQFERFKAFSTQVAKLLSNR